MTTIPAPLGLLARAAYAMNRVPSAEASFRSRPPAEPPAIGVIGGRESLSTHMGWTSSGQSGCTLIPRGQASNREWSAGVRGSTDLGVVSNWPARREDAMSIATLQQDATGTEIQ